MNLPMGEDWETNGCFTKNRGGKTPKWMVKIMENPISLSQWTLKKKSLNFILPTKYVIPKSLKFSHWPSKLLKWDDLGVYTPIFGNTQMLGEPSSCEPFSRPLRNLPQRQRRSLPRDLYYGFPDPKANAVGEKIPIKR